MEVFKSRMSKTKADLIYGDRAESWTRWYAGIPLNQHTYDSVAFSVKYI